MATVQRTLDIVLSVLDETGPGLRSVGAKIDDFAGAVESAGRPLADLTASLVKTEAAVLALGAAFVGVAINQAGEFDGRVREINTLFGGTEEQIAGMSSKLLDFGRTSSASISDITDATYNYISITGDAENAVAGLEAAENLSRAGKAGLNDSLVVLANSMQAYGAKSNEAAGYSDALFSVIQQGYTTLPELADGLGQITGIAAQAGVSFDDLLTGIAGFTASGAGNTASAITGIKSALASVIKPSGEAAAAAEALGVQFNSAALRSKGLAGFLDSVYSAADGNIETLSRLFGSVEGLNTVLALGADSSGKYATAIEAMRDKSGGAAEAAEALGKTVDTVNQNLVNNIQATLIQAGIPLLDQYGDSVRALSSVFAGLGEGIEAGAFDPILSALNSFGAELEGFLSGVAEALPEALAGIDYSGVVSAFSALRDTIGGLFGTLDLTEPEDLRRAVQFVVDSIESLTRTVDGAVAGMEPFIQQIFSAIESFNGLDDGVKQGAGSLLGFATASVKIAEAIGVAAGALSLFGGSVTALNLGGIVRMLATPGGLVSAFSGLATAVAAIGPAAVVAGSAFAGWKLGEWLQENVPLVEKFQSGLADLIDTFSGIDESVTVAMESQARAIETASKATEAASAPVENLSEKHAQLVDNLRLLNAAYARYSQELPEGDAKQAALNELQKSILNARAEFDLLTEAERAAAIAAADAGGQAAYYQRQHAEALSKSAESAGDLLGKIHGSDGAYRGMGQAASESLSSASKASDDLAKKTQAAIEKQQEMRIRLEEIASNERIKSIEFTAELQIASLEANAAQAEKIIDGLGETIQGTGELLGDLFGLFSAEDIGRSEQLFIEEQIRREDARRDEALEQQRRLNDAMIEAYQAQVDRLRRGDAMYKVSIDSTDLEPLGEIGLTILKKLQVAASLEGNNFLFGLSGG